MYISYNIILIHGYWMSGESWLAIKYLQLTQPFAGLKSGHSACAPFLSKPLWLFLKKCLIVAVIFSKPLCLFPKLSKPLWLSLNFLSHCSS